MDNKKIIQLLEHPEKLMVSDKDYIEEMLIKYPFTQSFQMLYLKWKEQFTLEDLTKDIQKVSIYTTYRELIKKVIKDKRNKEMPRLAQEQGKEHEDKMAIEKKIHSNEILKDVQQCKLKENDKPVSNNEKHEEEKIDTIHKTVDQLTQEITNEDSVSKDEEQKNNNQQRADISYKNIDKLGLSHLFLSDLNTEVKENTNEDQKENKYTGNSKENVNKEGTLLKVDQKNENFKQINKELEEEGEKEDNKCKIGNKLLEYETFEHENAITSVGKLTFNQWISLPKQKVIIKTEKVAPIQERQNIIISNFIENNPKIKPPQKEIKTIKEIEFKKEEIQDIANLMTITLAQLYVEQGKYDTAITAFKILSLKYPEKSSYFASEIRSIKKIKNSK